MIRRRNGSEFWLIIQHDHALISGELARRIGGELFVRPSAAAIEGISLHDSGWPIVDDAPLLNAANEPLDVFETPLSLGMKVWAESSRRAAAVDAYAGLLVSLHGLALSAYSVSQHRNLSDDRRLQFELNRFQHGEIELQETLRKQLGYGLDEPLTLGMNETSPDPAERELVYAFRLLQALDKISLDICFARVPFALIERVLPRPAGTEISLYVTRLADFALQVDPWPFESSKPIELPVRFKAIPSRRYADENELRSMYSAAPVDQRIAVIRPAK